MSLIKNFQKDWKESDTKDKCFMTAGALALLLALAGVFLPVLPQVPFAIAAALLFSKGSPRIHHWIRENKYFGQPVKDWEDHHAIRTKLKIFSIFGILLMGGFGHYKLPTEWAYTLDVLLLGSFVFVLTRKSSTQGPVLHKSTEKK